MKFDDFIHNKNKATPTGSQGLTGSGATSDNQGSLSRRQRDMTYSGRRQIDKNRRLVGGYSGSNLAGSYTQRANFQSDGPKIDIVRPSSRDGSLHGGSASVHRFTEPSPRPRPF